MMQKELYKLRWCLCLPLNAEWKPVKATPVLNLKFNCSEIIFQWYLHSFHALGIDVYHKEKGTTIKCHVFSIHS